jgi:hypothetical protein
VIVVTRESGCEHVRKYVTELYKGKLVIELVVVKDYMGGADSLIHIQHKLKVCLSSLSLSCFSLLHALHE